MWKNNLFLIKHPKWKEKEIFVKYEKRTNELQFIQSDKEYLALFQQLHKNFMSKRENDKETCSEETRNIVVCPFHFSTLLSYLSVIVVVNSQNLVM